MYSVLGLRYWAAQRDTDCCRRILAWGESIGDTAVDCDHMLHAILHANQSAVCIQCATL